MSYNAGTNSKIASFTDATINGPATNQALEYDAASAKWVNHTIVPADISGLETYVNNLISTANGGSSSGGTTTGGGSTTTNPSGEAMPTASLTNTNGTWNYIFGEDFTTTVTDASKFLTTAPYSTRWDAYDGGQDTAKVGTWSASRTMTATNSVWNIRVFEDNGSYICCGPVVGVSAKSGNGLYQTYGRYSSRMRVVAESGDTSGWAMATLLWSDEGTWPDYGETDFPEGTLGSSDKPGAFMHHTGTGGTNHGQDAYNSPSTWAGWHTYTCEWGPNLCEFFVDGVSIGKSTQYVPTGPMRWTFQTETAYGATPASGSIARVEVDWIAMWSRG